MGILVIPSKFARFFQIYVCRFFVVLYWIWLGFFYSYRKRNNEITQKLQFLVLGSPIRIGIKGKYRRKREQIILMYNNRQRKNEKEIFAIHWRLHIHPKPYRIYIGFFILAGSKHFIICCGFACVCECVLSFLCIMFCCKSRCHTPSPNNNNQQYSVTSNYLSHSSRIDFVSFTAIYWHWQASLESNANAILFCSFIRRQ